MSFYRGKQNNEFLSHQITSFRPEQCQQGFPGYLKNSETGIRAADIDIESEITGRSFPLSKIDGVNKSPAIVIPDFTEDCASSFVPVERNLQSNKAITEQDMSEYSF